MLERCAARGNEDTALQSARARRLREAQSILTHASYTLRIARGRGIINTQCVGDERIIILWIAVKR